jgi:hypothetical protein
MVAKSGSDWAFSLSTWIMIRFRCVLIKLIKENSGCYKFGILVALSFRIKDTEGALPIC